MATLIRASVAKEASDKKHISEINISRSIEKINKAVQIASREGKYRVVVYLEELNDVSEETLKVLFKEITTAGFCYHYASKDMNYNKTKILHAEITLLWGDDDINENRKGKFTF